MNDDPPSTEPTPESLQKEILKLRRRVGRLEAQLEDVETVRDTNLRFLDRVSGELEVEKARSRALLLNVLPEAIVERLDAGEQLIADRYDDVAVVFSDFVGFTEISARLEVGELVSSLNALFTAFDAACSELGVEKIKTIGDAYMAAAGLPGTRSDHVAAAADLTLAMRAAVRDAGEPWHVRIGLHRGPVVAGVIGTSKFVYDLWGDAVERGEPPRDHGPDRSDPGLGDGRGGSRRRVRARAARRDRTQGQGLDRNVPAGRASRRLKRRPRV